MQSIADFGPSLHTTSPQDPVPISQMDDWLKCKEVNVTVTESLGKPGEKRHKEAKVLPDQGDIGGPTSKQADRLPPCMAHCSASLLHPDTPPTAAGKKCQVHTVKEGETGSIIAGIYGVSLADLAATNSGTDVRRGLA